MLNGHDHDYERFAPLSADGQLDTNGVREFIAGTGGESHYKFHLPATGSQLRIANTFGVLRLALEPGAYEWRFVSTSGATLDAGRRLVINLGCPRRARAGLAGRPSPSRHHDGSTGQS